MVRFDYGNSTNLMLVTSSCKETFTLYLWYCHSVCQDISRNPKVHCRFTPTWVIYLRVCISFVPSHSTCFDRCLVSCDTHNSILPPVTFKFSGFLKFYQHIHAQVLLRQVLKFGYQCQSHGFVSYFRSRNLVYSAMVVEKCISDGKEQSIYLLILSY